MFADVTQPLSWLPQNPDDIPAFLTWLAQFQTELDGVKEAGRRRLIQEGGPRSLLNAYQEEMARRRQGDQEIARLRHELERHKKEMEKKNKKGRGDKDKNDPEV
jgi:hypothetical protein